MGGIFIYLLDFFQKVIRKSNASIIIYLAINVLVIVGIFSNGFSSWQGIFIGVLAYIVSLALALSPIGEAILRWQLGAKPIQREDHLSRLMPLFNEVYARANEMDSNLPKDIKLYINKDMNRNAFATGRKTICLTRGILDSSDEEIKGVLAHEFGHLSNKDTDLILLITIGNLFTTAFFLIYRWTFLLIGYFVGIFYRSWTALIMTFFIDVILVALMSLWTKLGIMLVMHSSRKNEFEADYFAHKLGYGLPLIEVLNSFGDDIPYRKGIFATLVASHPDPDERIAKIQTLEGKPHAY